MPFPKRKTCWCVLTRFDLPLFVSPLLTLPSSSRVWVAGILNRNWLTGRPSAFSSLGSGGNRADNFRTRASRILSAFSFCLRSSASLANLSASSFSRAASFSRSAYKKKLQKKNLAWKICVNCQDKLVTSLENVECSSFVQTIGHFSQHKICHTFFSNNHHVMMICSQHNQFK